MPHRTSPSWPPAVSVWSLVKYSAAGKLSILTLVPANLPSNSGRRSASVSASLPVRTCRRSSAPELWATGAAAGADVAGAVVAGAGPAHAANRGLAALASAATPIVLRIARRLNPSACHAPAIVGVPLLVPAD